MTRRGLAERLGVTANTVARWECESESVPSECLGKLAEALHVPVDDLLALHAQSTRGARARNAPSAPLPTKRILPYPISGSLTQMRQLGGVATALSTRVCQRMTRPAYDRFIKSFPRDNALQLLAAHHFLGCGADVRKLRLLDLGCGLLVTQRTRKLYDGDRNRYAMMLAGDDWLIVLAPQVSLGIPTCPQIYRADFLGLYVDSYGHRQWVDVTIDDSSPDGDPHAQCPLVLGIPRFRFGSDRVTREDFGISLIAEIRRHMMSDVLHRRGITTLRVRQPRRQDAPMLKGILKTTGIDEEPTR